MMNVEMILIMDRYAALKIFTTALLIYAQSFVVIMTVKGVVLQGS